MITPKLKWIFLLSLPLITGAQIARSYDTNDWIPIDPNSQEGPKKATGRVLNLDAPNQKFFPDDEYVKKPPQTQQYLQETSLPKRPPLRQHQVQEPYKFETAVTPPRPLLSKGQLQDQQRQFIQPQYVLQIPQTQRSQYLQQTPSQDLRAPPQNSPNLYEPRLQQYNIPFNNSFFQSLNPGAINRELSGSIQNDQNIPQQLQLVLTTTPRAPEREKENVQLLYVPLENLRPSQPDSQPSQNVYLQVNSPRQDKQVPTKTQHHKHSQIQNIEQDFVRQALAAHKLQQQLQLGQPILLQPSTTTITPKPKKRKPHQPPLAVYMGKDGHVDVNDVLNVLKRTKIIAVQDSVGPDSPQVFVGPSNLDPPEGYTKFPLPYLSSIDGNRVERKVEQFPFFVAPLSYKAPDGYSKIALPSPHVGSVIVKELHEKQQKTKSEHNNRNQVRQSFEPTPQFGAGDLRLTQYLIQTTTPALGQELIGLTGEILPAQINSKEASVQNHQLLPARESPSEYQIAPKQVINNHQDTLTKEFLTNYKLLTEPQSDVNYRLAEGSNLNNYQASNYQTQIAKESIEQPTQNYQTNSRDRIKNSQQFAYFNQPTQDYETSSRESSQQATYFDVTVPNYQQSKYLEQTPQDYGASSRGSTKTLHYNKYTTEIIPSRELDINSANDQFQSVTEQNLITPKNPAGIYDFSDTPIKSTTTEVTLGLNQNRERLILPSISLSPSDFHNEANDQNYHHNLAQNKKQSTLRQVTNQFPFDNQHIGSTGRVQGPTGSSTPLPNLSTYNYDKYEIPSTTRRSKKRQRVKNTSPATTTTSASYDSDQYTVLEEFSIHPKSTTTQRYSTEVETIPVNVYQLNSQEINSGIEQNQESIKQHVLNQEMLDRQILHAHPQPLDLTTKSQQLFEIVTEEPQATPLVFPRGNNAVTQLLRPQDPHQETSQQNYHQFQEHHQHKLTQQPLQLQQQQREGSQIDQGQHYEPQHQQQQLTQSSPYISGLINNLQDPAVKPLLLPNLLVPTTEHLLLPATSVEPKKETTIKIVSTEAPAIETTTPFRRTRGRQRNTSSRVTTTSVPRRTVSRKRPTNSRTTSTTERIERTTTQHLDYEPTKRNRQRFRTRGRPVQREQQIANERSSSQKPVIKDQRESGFKPSSFEGGFQASPGEPNSYMQFDHVVNDQEVITVKTDVSSREPQKDYYQIYNVLQSSNINEKTPEEESRKPVVDIQITHPINEKLKDPVILAKPNDQSQYVQFHSNIQSGGVLYNNRNREEQTTVPPRVRGRTRSRSRFSSTTSRSTTTTTRTTTTPKPKQEDSEEEYFGFIRPPNFNKPALLVLTTTQRTRYTTPQTLIHFDDDVDDVDDALSNVRSSTPVHFVGEIRPKYPSITTDNPEDVTETTKFRTSGRIRVTPRRPTADNSYNEVSSPRGEEEQMTRRSTTIRGGRGKAHFKLPDRFSKTQGDDEDVEGGNYPVPYMRSKQEVTEKSPAFQITVDPYAEEVVDDEDQESHSSYNNPIVLRNPPQWVEASALPTFNDIPIEDRKMKVDNSKESTEQNSNEGEKKETEEAQATTQPVETSTSTVKSRRRGVWKLIKHRPVDEFESAESQNYQSVLNGFDDIIKTKNPPEEEVPVTTPIVSSTDLNLIKANESSLMATLYNMFGFSDKTNEESSLLATLIPVGDESTTTVVPPTFPEEFTEQTTTQVAQEAIGQNSQLKYETGTVANDTTGTTESYMKTYEVEPWNMREVRTSTSTEISHETEICYKGRCVKTKDDEPTL